MNTELKLMLLSARIEYHWKSALSCRKRGNRLIERGESLSSDAIVRLSQRIDSHNCAIHRLQSEYKGLSA